MKVIFIKTSVLYKVIAVILAIFAIFTIISIVNNNEAKKTFKQDGEVFYKGNIDVNTIAFTCNVDWGNEYIPSLLEILRNNNIKITFFVTGKWAEKYPELLKNIYDEGHEIGNHGYAHKDYSKLNYNDNKLQISKAHDILKNNINTSPYFFAPPAGAYNDDTVKAANDLNYEVIMWNIDTIDWRKDSTHDKIINRVLSKAQNSAIVLMHPKEETIKALPTIIEGLKEKGYNIGKVSDVVKR